MFMLVSMKLSFIYTHILKYIYIIPGINDTFLVCIYFCCTAIKKLLRVKGDTQKLNLNLYTLKNKTAFTKRNLNFSQ